jgi:hypothetical protein
VIDSFVNYSTTPSSSMMSEPVFYNPAPGISFLIVEFTVSPGHATGTALHIKGGNAYIAVMGL